MYASVGRSRDQDENGERCEIFYQKDRLEVVESETFWLSETPSVVGSKSWDTDCTRICTWAKFNSKADGKTFVVYNTHLDHISSKARQEGIKLICEQANSYIMDGVPIILMGDMNVYPDSEVVRLVQQSGLNNVQDVSKDPNQHRKTFHDFKGGLEGEPIDYIFTSQNIRIQHAYIDRLNYQSRYPSDHYPVTATSAFE